jgi:hypothetical protein
MAVSSASTRIFKAEDPVMSTDLELLAKVNEYQQSKFDEGEKNLQNEINNWSLLSQVAKPQDKEYINQKLNKLVSGINSLGGINLKDPNNVNALKSLGYNMYGDDRVMNPVITTQKMNALAKDVTAKTSGKNAKDYDSVYGEHLLSQYQDWLNDGQQGTAYNGPTSLPQGSFDNYNKKVNDALAKLQPDINEAPQDNKDAALNYYQVGDKFIKKDRVEAAINAVTSAQDKEILSAHAWKSMQGLPDDYIVNLQRNDYNSQIKEAQDNYNYLQYQKSLTSDFKQKQLFDSQMDQLKGSISGIQKQSKGLPNLAPGQELPKEMRDQLSDNLFFNSFKDQYASARAFEQKKVELKSNQAAMFTSKQNQEDYWHAKNYDRQVKEDKIRDEQKDRDLAIKEGTLFQKLYGVSNGAANGTLGGPNGSLGAAANAPLSLVPVKGKDDSTQMGDKTIVQADANVTAAAKNFYENGYNYLMGKDPVLYGNYLKQDTDGNWVPKDAKSTDIVNKGLQSFIQMFGNIANMSIKERSGMQLNTDDLALYESSKDLEEANLYKNQIHDITNDVFRKAGLTSPDQKTITFALKGGKSVTVSYSKLKEMAEKKDPLLDQWKANVDFDYHTPEEKAAYESMMKKPLAAGLYKMSKSIPGQNPVDNAIGTVNDYYQQSSVEDAWKAVSATVNPYARVISLPKAKNGQLPDIAAKTLSEAITDPKVKGDVDIKEIDLNKVWTTYDPNTNTPHYYGEIKYRNAQKGKDVKGAGGDKYTKVDLSSVVDQQMKNGGGWLSNLFTAGDNASVVYGLALQNEGKTPFDPKTNFEGALQTHGQGLLAHKYQVVSIKDPKTGGVAGYKVFVAIPLGKDDTGNPKFQTLPVPNFLSDASGRTTTFPANFEGVRAYMETAFKDTTSAQDFYTRLGVPYNQ